MKTDSGGMHDYGRPEPSREVIARLGELADLLVAAAPADRYAIEQEMADHMLQHGIPLADFDAPCGHRINVKLSVANVVVRPGQESAAKAWLGGRKMDSALRSCIRNGRAVPNEIFDLKLRTVIKPAA